MTSNYFFSFSLEYLKKIGLTYSSYTKLKTGIYGRTYAHTYVNLISFYSLHTAYGTYVRSFFNFYVLIKILFLSEY